MKLEKITEKLSRSYDDACGTALALDLVGERWAMLVMRELLLGPRRFGDLRNGLPGISANVLTQRLEGLEAVGVVMRSKLPPPASVQVYGLTPWGMEAEPFILGLGRWAVRSPLHNPDAPLSAVGLMLSFKTMFTPERTKGMDFTVAFKMGEDAYWVRVHDGELIAERGVPPTADLEVFGEPGVIGGVMHGMVDAAEMERAGQISFKGNRAIIPAFSSLFQMPPKVGALDAAE